MRWLRRTTLHVLFSIAERLAANRRPKAAPSTHKHTHTPLSIKKTNRVNKTRLGSRFLVARTSELTNSLVVRQEAMEVEGAETCLEVEMHLIAGSCGHKRRLSRREPHDAQPANTPRLRPLILLARALPWGPQVAEVRVRALLA